MKDLTLRKLWWEFTVQWDHGAEYNAGPNSKCTPPWEDFVAALRSRDAKYNWDCEVGKPDKPIVVQVIWDDGTREVFRTDDPL